MYACADYILSITMLVKFTVSFVVELLLPIGDFVVVRDQGILYNCSVPFDIPCIDMYTYTTSKNN